MVSLPRVADDEHDDERQEEPSEDDEGAELDPEQREALRKTIDQVQRSLSSTINFKLPLYGAVGPRLGAEEHHGPVGVR